MPGGAPRYENDCELQIGDCGFAGRASNPQSAIRNPHCHGRCPDLVRRGRLGGRCRQGHRHDFPRRDPRRPHRLPRRAGRHPLALAVSGVRPAAWLGVGAEEGRVRVMTARFLAYWRPGGQARLDSLHWSRAQLVTLASIIQAEVRYAPDREYVSAVYHNRLKRRMKLEADPTVIYAYGRRLKRVYEKNLLIRSPYNTYLHPGLPPGPIGQPDTASLRAALYPAPVPFLYFVAQPDGKHIFSVTFAEHLAAIRAVHRMRIAARARQTPGR